MNKSALTGWLICTSLLLGSGVLHAQAPTLVEQITLPTGSVFEITVDHQIEDPVYNWSFSRGSTFLQAGRNQEFRVRLVEPGTYKLSGKVRNNSDNISYRKEIQINVPQQQPTQTPVDTVEGIISSASPSLSTNKQIVLAPGKDLVRLMPKSDNTNAILLDLNSAFDANGDGNPKNDYVAQNSFFSTKSTPVTIWFTTPVTKRTLSLSLADVPNSEQEITILSTEEARKIAVTSTPNESADTATAPVQVTIHNAGTVQFSVNLKNEPYASAPLLIHWDFGDGQQSMLDAPVHTYAKNGAYNVKVSIRNLKTNDIEEEFTSSVRVQNIVAPPVGPEGKESKDEEDKEGGGFGAMFMTVLKFLVGIGASIAVGFFVIFVFGLLKKKGGIQGALDKAEDALMPEEKPKEPAPMKLEAVTAEIVEEPPKTEVVEEPKPDPEPAKETPQPEAAAEEVPDWLQEGIEKAKGTGQTVESPPPAALQEETPPAEEPATPPSLVEPAETEPTPETEPEPIIEPAPAQTQSEAAAEEVPNWLQQGMEEAAATGQTAASPPPPTLKQEPIKETPPPPLPSELVEGESIPAPAEPLPDEALFRAQVGEPESEEDEKDWSQMSPEEKEKARKRSKRQRYRKNKRERVRSEKETDVSAEPAPEPIAKAPIPEPQEQEIPPASEDDEVKFLIQAEGVDETPKGEEKHE